MKEQVCRNCVHWDFYFGDEGKCRRYAPSPFWIDPIREEKISEKLGMSKIIMTSPCWPTTSFDDFCGDWALKGDQQ